MMFFSAHRLFGLFMKLHVTAHKHRCACVQKYTQRERGSGEMSMLLESAVLKSKPRASLTQPRVLPTELLPPSLFLTFTFICASQDSGLQYTFCLNSLVYRVCNLTPGTLQDEIYFLLALNYDLCVWDIRGPMKDTNLFVGCVVEIALILLGQVDGTAKHLYQFNIGQSFFLSSFLSFLVNLFFMV